MIDIERVINFGFLGKCGHCKRRNIKIIKVEQIIRKSTIRNYCYLCMKYIWDNSYLGDDSIQFKIWYSARESLTNIELNGW